MQLQIFVDRELRQVGLVIADQDANPVVTIRMQPSEAITCGLRLVTAANSLIFPGAHVVTPTTVRASTPETDHDQRPDGDWANGEDQPWA